VHAIPASPEAHGAVGSATLQLSGLHCAACAGDIEAALAGVAGVIEARVNAAASLARVRWDARLTQPSRLIAAVQSAGYGAAPDTAAGARALRAAEARRWTWRLFVAAFCGMQVMMLATPVYVADPGTLAPDIERLLHLSAWTLTLPVLCFSATPFFAGAWRSVRSGRIGMDVPVALGIAIAFVASSGAAFAPGGLFGREVYFDSLTMFVAFLLAGRWLEARARHRAIETVERLAHARPALAQRLRADGGVDEVAAEALAVGDRVRVPMGEPFPADGRIEAGRTQADESLLTGESSPLDKAEGDAVVAGSMNLRAPVVLRVERVGADTRQEQIAALMREAMTSRPQAVSLADRVAGPFLVAVLGLAVLAALVWWPVDPSRALRVAVSVLIVTCPCALSLAAPAAQLAALSALARRGVWVRHLGAIDRLSQVRQVMLDKTGTVTEAQPGTPRLVALAGAADAGRFEADADRAASLAASSTHPLSRALAAARRPGFVTAWHDVHERPGIGIEARDADGVRWRLGAPAAAGGAAVVDAAAVFYREDEPRLALQFEETLRDGAAEGVLALRQSGLALTLLSGDAQPRVQALARRLGIEAFVAGATPEGKLERLRAAQAAGDAVVMVGDGVNDAPVLAQADVSFAMGGGAGIAQQGADAVLLSGRLGDVAHAVALARRTRRVVRQNLAWAAAYNAACVPLALLGWLAPWAAGLGMAASSLAVVGNAWRLAR
jgi:Cu2+-exporting ATPase